MAFDIAVVGIGGTFPGANCIASFLDLIKSDVSHIIDISAHVKNHEDNYIPFKGVLHDAFLFDAELFGFSKADAQILDPQHRIFFQTAYRALESAGYVDPKTIDRKVGVYASCGFPGYLFHYLANNDEIRSKYDDLYIQLLNDKDFLATRFSYLMNFNGPSVNVQCGCSSSLVGVHLAAQSLLLQECDVAVVGGSSISYPIYGGYTYSEGSIASKDGKIYSFDDQASGTVRGDGCGVVVFKRLEDAIESQDRIFAVIKGSAITNDGKNKIGFTAPGLPQQINVIKEALITSEVEDLDFVEAHATGTKIGDPIEIMALAEVFKNKKEKLTLTSVKPHIGHLDVASGIASFIKTCLCLYDGILPHTLNFRKLNSMVPSAEDKVQVLQKYRKLENRSVITAGVTSLGMGGTNVHVILESMSREKSHLDTSYRQFNLEEYVVTPCNTNGKNQKITEENDIDKLVRNAWSQILGVERLSAHDNFFDLGGNSFSAVQCIGMFPDKIKKKMNVLDFLTHPTLDDFISHLKSKL
jgi:acyl transferase domain-containing protein